MEEKKQIKEDFCPICVAAVPIAFGVGTISNSKSNENDEENDEIEEDNDEGCKQKNNFNFIKWISIFLLVSGLISLIFILREKK